MHGDGFGLPAVYVEMQLRFAHRAAMVGTHDFASAVTELTNLHRRLGLGDATAVANAWWARYLDGLAARPNLDDQVRWTLSCAAAPKDPPPPKEAAARVGPFSVQIEGDTLRTHFTPRPGGEPSPLHPSELPRRRAELRDVLTEGARQHPGARRVRGTSWLYSTAAYRSLFPPAHVASATPAHLVRFQGFSAWGQFLDHRGDVKANLVARFLDALDGWGGEAPWRLFPLPTLTVESPIEVFGLDLVG